ncbi:MAG: 2-succinyl-5-enolpyruvyl-6-hydroxy-3-cyclohexene-1-carboxylic-acid synthase [Planctomycetota bacterium]|nr:2-succinyl-5-enolpyruvyl-6-hydroxy-3-cyclohexene-1-carboxylic-acid synthase [Planctomycetota bacterium]
MSDWPNINAACASLLLEECARQGIRHAVASPGSRSALLVIAAERCATMQLTMVIDERSAGFCALGMARATGTAAVVMTTSGTAAVNLYPAVVEASQRGTPMIILTADRPVELLDCGANQTIRQSQLFGSFVRWSIDLPAPLSGCDPRLFLSTIDQAIAHATGPNAGPVHINCAFAEPLSLESKPWSFATGASIRRWKSSNEPWRKTHSQHVGLRDASELEAKFSAARRGVLVVGGLDDPDSVYHARALAQRVPWPVIADIASGLRFPHVSNRVCVHGSLILRSVPEMIAACAPDVVLRIGGPCAWKQVDEWCAKAPQLIVVGQGMRCDPAHAAMDHASISLAELAGLDGWKDCNNSGALIGWQRADATVQSVLQSQLTMKGSKSLDEPSVARAVFFNAPEECTVMLSSSMPVRDADAFGGASDRVLRVAANRGASGIDGILATAAGHAIATASPVIVLLGDLAAWHDASSFELIRRVKGPVHVVIVNNDGGGIFEALPVAADRSLFEKLFATPHGTNFEGMARQCSLDYRKAETTAVLNKALADAFASPQSTLTEVKIDRASSVARRRVLMDTVGDALRTTV